jgi:hypothetical protein
MNVRITLFAAAVGLIASAQSACAGDGIGAGYLGSFPFYWGDYPYYEGSFPPNPLYAPFGYYGCRGGCCRRAVSSGRHWHNLTTCSPAASARWKATAGLNHSR